MPEAGSLHFSKILVTKESYKAKEIKNEELRMKNGGRGSRQVAKFAKGAKRLYGKLY